MKQKVFLFILCIVNVYLFADMDSSLALIYQNHIFQLLQDNKTSEAEYLLQDAMEYDSGFSGLWFAAAEIEYRSMEYRKALESARRAYSLNQWSGSDYHHFMNLYGTLLERMGLYGEFCSVFQELQWNSTLDPALMARYAESLRKKGDIEAAIMAAEKGLSLFVDEPRFFTTLLAVDYEKYLVVFDDLWGDDASLVSEIVEPVLWFSDTGELREYYIGKGVDDWKKEFWKTSYWDVASVEAYLGQYEYISEMKYISAIYRQSDRDTKRLLLDFLRQTQERYLWDQNYDGISDAYLAFQGNQWLFQYDLNQDGSMEGSMRFSPEFIPETFSKTVPEGEVVIEYQWPFIREMIWNRSSKKLVYQINRGDLKSLIPPAFSGDFLDYCEVIEQLDWSMNEYDILSKSSNISEYTESSILFRRYFLQNGRIFIIREDSDLNGKPDRLIQTDHWIPLAAIRDLDEDGSFDIYEYFHNGQWEGIFLDNDKDKIGSYIESWNPLELLIWDFNQDGFMDTGFNKLEKRAIIISDEKEQIPLGETLFWNFDFSNFWFQ